MSIMMNKFSMSNEKTERQIFSCIIKQKILFYFSSSIKMHFCKDTKMLILFRFIRVRRHKNVRGNIRNRTSKRRK